VDAYVEECGREVGVGEAGFWQLDGRESDSAGGDEVHRDRVGGHEFGGSVAGFDGVAARIFEGYPVSFVSVVHGCGLSVDDFLRSGLVRGLRE